MARNPDDKTASRFAGFEGLPVLVTVSVGGTRCRLGRLAELQPGEVIALDRRVGRPFELRAGEVLLARVEPVAHGDGVAVKVVEIPGDQDADER